MAIEKRIIFTVTIIKRRYLSVSVGKWSHSRALFEEISLHIFFNVPRWLIICCLCGTVRRPYLPTKPYLQSHCFIQRGTIG